LLKLQIVNNLIIFNTFAGECNSTQNSWWVW